MNIHDDCEQAYRNGLEDGKPKWIPVTERLPKEWEEVLVWSRFGFCEVAVYLGIPGKWRVTWNHDLLEVDSITHWMPLPEPPKQERKDNSAKPDEIDFDFEAED